MSGSYRFAWAIWIACSALETAIYFLFTDLHAHGAHGALPVSTIVLQALVLPYAIARARFGSRADAAIRGASAGLAWAGVAALLFALIEHRLHPVALVLIASLQPDYILTILLISGLAGGLQLGLLRWRSAHPPSASSRAAGSAWPRYARSALVWIASVTLCGAASAGVISGSSSLIFLTLSPLGAGVAFAGLIVVASIPAIRPAPDAARARFRVWRYAWQSFAVLVFLWALATLLSLASRSLAAIYLIGGAPYALILWVPCGLWAVLYGISEAPDGSSAPDRPASSSRWRTATWGAGAQTAALVAAISSASPAALGFAGLGCVTTYNARASEYRFWEAYKGIGARVDTPSRLIFRPSIDRTACIVLDQQNRAYLDDAAQVTLGYAEAARSWFWLIDPETWDSARTKDIRQSLASLIGRDFPSYAELQAWWNENGDDLIWSGSKTLLEPRPRTPQDLAHPKSSPRMRYESVPPSAVERVRRYHGEDDGDPFGAALLDREARLRGLDLAAADAIAVLSGERDQKARAFLQQVTGRQLTTKAEWQSLFADPHPPAPWRMSRTSAQDWIGLIEAYGLSDRYRAYYVERLRDETGLNYATPEAFLPWLRDPANTRGDEWRWARNYADQLTDEQNPDASARLAMGWLANITTESFASASGWVAWWRAHRAGLALSPDGHRLVTAS